MGAHALEVIGKAYWRGGQGRPGEYGGWGYKCAFCSEGSRLKSMPRKSVAQSHLIVHVTAKHPNRVITINGKKSTVTDFLKTYMTSGEE